MLLLILARVVVALASVAVVIIAVVFYFFFAPQVITPSNDCLIVAYPFPTTPLTVIKRYTKIHGV